MSRLFPRNLTLAYDSQAVITGLTHPVTDDRITGIIGPNACGKSTLLRACARLLRPAAGRVVLDGEAIHTMPTREVARRLGLLPQHAGVPEAISVEDLVRRGRYPHQPFLHALRHEDEHAVDRALALAGLDTLRDRLVDELSGGQRQRAWIAMVLAQETDLMLLDEPTTYLDLSHRREVLALLHRLNEEEHRTIVVVLHDVNDAAEVCDELVAMRDGAIVACGPTGSVLGPELLARVFGVECDLVGRRDGAKPYVVARSRALASVRGSDPAGRGDPASVAPPAIRATRLCGGYPGRAVLARVSLDIPRGAITAIVGPNACGKSTLLRTLARLLPAAGGAVELATRASTPDRRGSAMRSPTEPDPHSLRPTNALSPRELARSISLLEQGTNAPPEVTVEDLVAVGRFPYQRWYAQWSRADRRVVEHSMELVAVADLRHRRVGSLSGGQRRRAMLAMALAQESQIVMLDEPTTFLDIAHQAEILDLAYGLNRNEARTVIMVLHDLWQAMRYADHIVVMNGGRIAATGTPARIAASDVAQDVFGVELCPVPDPQTGRPLLVPAGVRQAVVA